MPTSRVSTLTIRLTRRMSLSDTWKHSSPVRDKYLLNKGISSSPSPRNIKQHGWSRKSTPANGCAGLAPQCFASTGLHRPRPDPPARTTPILSIPSPSINLRALRRQLESSTYNGQRLTNPTPPKPRSPRINRSLPSPTKKVTQPRQDSAEAIAISTATSTRPNKNA